MLTRRIIRLIAAAAIGSSALLALPSLVAASCNPHRVDDNNYYWTYVGQGPGTSVGGVVSNIWNYAPYVPTGRFSYSWVMLTLNANYWAQIGNYEAVQGRSVYLQYQDGAPPAHFASFGPQPIGFSTYEVEAIGGLFSYYDAGTLVFTHSASWVPRVGQFSSEIPSLNTQMMGAINNAVDFLGNKMFYNGAWHNLAGSLTNTGSAYFGMSGTATSFATWDKACSN